MVTSFTEKMADALKSSNFTSNKHHYKNVYGYQKLRPPLPLLTSHTTLIIPSGPNYQISTQHTIMNVPESLKFVQSTLARGKELETRDPVISYYCKLHSVQQILAKSLHQSDPEVAEFSSNLLDQVESFKNNELSDEKYQSIINDEQVAQTYVENFALKVFTKADNEVRDHRTTKNTSSTFMAAVVFLDTLKVFQNPLEAHLQDKIKYAKFHAARIVKAYKNNEDPNDFEPEPEPEQPVEEELQQQEFDGEPDIKKVEVLEGKEETEEDIPKLPAQPSTFLSQNSSPTPADLPQAPPVLPSAPADAPVGKHGLSLPSAPANLPERPESPEKQQPPPPPPPAPPKPVQTHKSITNADVDSIMQQTNIISEAQKRAKFAISALNYEDVETAKSELQQALSMLNSYSI